jgi:hypothetical protein
LGRSALRPRANPGSLEVGRPLYELFVADLGSHVAYQRNEWIAVALEVEQVLGAKLQYPEVRIEQRPDDQILLDTLARVGEPIGLFGPDAELLNPERVD